MLLASVCRMYDTLTWLDVLGACHIHFLVGA